LGGKKTVDVREAIAEAVDIDKLDLGSQKLEDTVKDNPSPSLWTGAPQPPPRRIPASAPGIIQEPQRPISAQLDKDQADAFSKKEPPMEPTNKEEEEEELPPYQVPTEGIPPLAAEQEAQRARPPAPSPKQMKQQKKKPHTGRRVAGGHEKRGDAAKENIVAGSRSPRQSPRIVEGSPSQADAEKRARGQGLSKPYQASSPAAGENGPFWAASEAEIWHSVPLSDGQKRMEALQNQGGGRTGKIFWEAQGVGAAPIQGIIHEEDVQLFCCDGFQMSSTTQTTMPFSTSFENPTEQLWMSPDLSQAFLNDQLEDEEEEGDYEEEDDAAAMAGALAFALTQSAFRQDELERQIVEEDQGEEDDNDGAEIEDMTVRVFFPMA
jgi:hypothetical protein